VKASERIKERGVVVVEFAINEMGKD